MPSSHVRVGIKQALSLFRSFVSTAPGKDNCSEFRLWDVACGFHCHWEKVRPFPIWKWSAPLTEHTCLVFLCHHCHSHLVIGILWTNFFLCFLEKKCYGPFWGDLWKKISFFLIDPFSAKENGLLCLGFEERWENDISQQAFSCALKYQDKLQPPSECHPQWATRCTECYSFWVAHSPWASSQNQTSHAYLKWATCLFCNFLLSKVFLFYVSVSRHEQGMKIAIEIKNSVTVSVHHVSGPYGWDRVLLNNILFVLKLLLKINDFYSKQVKYSYLNILKVSIL